MFDTATPLYLPACLRWSRRSRVLAVVTLGLLVVGCSRPGSQTESTSKPVKGADLVVTGGKIHTAVAGQADVTALAITNGRLVYVGDDAGALEFVGANTEKLALQGERVLPGLHDVHQHTLEAHLPIITCLVDGTQTDPEAYIDEIVPCKPAEDTGWILGHGHRIDTLLAAKRAPRLILDDTKHSGPIAIMEATSHSTWVNTKALELLNITDKTPDPPGGVIVRDANGAATGLLVDAAGEWPWDRALQPTEALKKTNILALLDGLKHNNQWGITSAVDARTYWQRGYLDAYHAVAKSGDMTVRMALSLWASPVADDGEQLAKLKQLYADGGEILRISMVKLYVDGLLENTTAAMLAPYDAAPLFDAKTGLNYFDATRLKTYFKTLTDVGYRIHAHAIGNRAVREALDAVEATGSQHKGHRLTHVEVVDPSDIPRFAKLGVYADMQLNSHVHDTQLKHYAKLIGSKRATPKYMWPLRQLWDAKAVVALSSDYDVGKLSPFFGMQQALILDEERKLPDVAAAVRAYTVNAAIIMGSEKDTGTLEVGKYGDFVVLDRDIFNIEVGKFAATQVELTVLGGKEVFRDPGFAR